MRSAAFASGGCCGGCGSRRSGLDRAEVQAGQGRSGLGRLPGRSDIAIRWHQVLVSGHLFREGCPCPAGCSFLARWGTTQVLEYEVGLGECDGGVTAEVNHDEVAQMLCAGRRDVNVEVHRPDEEEDAGNLWQAGYPAHEFADPASDLLRNSDCDRGLDGAAQGRRINVGVVAADYSVLA